MYASFFGLAQAPFSIAPDPRYLYMSDRHREALAHLLYGVGAGGGFVLLTGEIGAGKTTVCRCFLEQIPPGCHVAYIFNPKLTVLELLQTICEEFQIESPSPDAATPPGLKEHVDRLNAYLLQSHAQGHQNVLIIDEAQNLPADVLEQLRLLTNLETNERKLLQIILIGQPELRDMLARPDMEQMAQRVIARYHLDALTEPETFQYIQHRLKVAGLANAKLFSADAVKRIHRWSRGVPRRINVLCDRALLGAYAENTSQVDVRIVDKAAGEVFPKASRQRSAAAANTSARASTSVRPKYSARRQRRSNWMLGAVATLGLAGVISAAWMGYQQRSATWQTARQNAPQLAEAPKVLAVAAHPSTPQALASDFGPAVATSASAASAPFTAPASASQPSPVDTTVSATQVFAQAMSDENAALRDLMHLWQVPTVAGDVCSNVWRRELMCHISHAGLSQIQQLDRPVMLRLRSQGGSKFALLTKLDAKHAHLQIQGQTMVMPLEALSNIWRGEFTTLWRTPPGYRGKLLLGQNNVSVGWVASQLAKSQGRVLPRNATTLFDADLEAKVLAFQLANGLTPDGVVGATTLMHLNRVAGLPEPRLLAVPIPSTSNKPAHVLHP